MVDFTDTPGATAIMFEPVRGREIDVAFGIRGRGAVMWTLPPGVDVEVHSPPDAVVLHRPDPARVLNPAGRIELETEERRRQLFDAIE